MPQSQMSRWTFGKKIMFIWLTKLLNREPIKSIKFNKFPRPVINHPYSLSISLKLAFTAWNKYLCLLDISSNPRGGTAFLFIIIWPIFWHNTKKWYNHAKNDETSESFGNLLAIIMEIFFSLIEKQFKRYFSNTPFKV